MPTPVEEFAFWNMITGTEIALRQIDPAQGYNTRPTVLEQWPGVSGIPLGDLPALYVFPFTSEKDERHRAYGKNRQLWDLGIFGVVDDQTDPRKQALALLADICAAIWKDEQATARGEGVHSFDLDTVEFEIVDTADSARGVILPVFNVLTSLSRTANP